MNIKNTLELSSELHCILDYTGNIREINTQFVQALRYTRAELLQKNFFDLVLEDAGEIKKKFYHPVTDVFPLTCKLRSFNDFIRVKGQVKKGEDEYFYLVANIVFLQDAPLARFRRFFDVSLLDIVVIATKTGDIVYANKGFSDTLGFTWQEMSTVSWIDFVYPEDKEETTSLLEEMRYTEGLSKNFVNRCISKTDEYKWISWRAIYTKNYYYAVAHNITDRKRQELKIQELLNSSISLNQRLEIQNEELLQSQDELKNTLDELEVKNFELDQFVYKVSHDLRAPLTSILGLVNLSKSYQNDAKNLVQYIDLMEKSTLKLDKFIKSLLDYSRSTRADVVIEEIDFEELIQNIFDDLRFLNNFDTIEKVIKIEKKLNFWGELLRIRIIFNNIISNAIKYQNPQAEQKKLHIRIDISEKQAEVIFWDNGIGIKNEYIQHVFDMFFRATEKSEGSGLGLYIVKQTVEKLHGTFEIKSEYGTFTQFRFLIPNHPPSPSTND